MEPDIEAIHASIHAEYRQALADSQWALAQSNAQGKVKDGIIAELRSLIEVAATAGE